MSPTGTVSNVNIYENSLSENVKLYSAKRDLQIKVEITMIINCLIFFLTITANGQICDAVREVFERVG